MEFGWAQSATREEAGRVRCEVGGGNGRHHGDTRSRRATYAGLVFGGVGAVFGSLVAADPFFAAPNGERVAVALVPTVGLSGIAAGIAAMIPQHKEVIYSAPALSGGSGSGK